MLQYKILSTKNGYDKIFSERGGAKDKIKSR